MTPAALSEIAGAGLDEGAMADLSSFAQMVGRWNARINLISPDTLPEIWARHVADSAQLYRHLPETAKSLVDIGSGGGFPGIVLAIILRALGRKMKIDLIESDRRKAAFLGIALRDLRLEGKVHGRRAEEVDPLDADIVTARALAPLDRLAPLVMRHLGSRGIGIFPKGRQHMQEIAVLPGSFRVRDIARSLTENGSAIILIERGNDAATR
jgi:16S rRNA (guanine527-N7)-methyltransferase